METAGHAPPVNRHHETHGVAFGLAGLVVGVRDVGFHGFVKRLFGGRHRLEAILHIAFGDGGTQPSGFGVAAQQLPRVARDEVADGRVRAHQCEGGLAFLRLQLAARSGGFVAQRGQQLARG